MKKMIIYTSIIAVIIILLAGVGYFLWPKYQTNSIKTYTSPDGTYSFQYPEFKGWEVTDQMLIDDDNQNSIYFNNPTLANLPKNGIYDIELPRIDISRDYSVTVSLSDKLPKNINGVVYTKYNNSFLSFIGKTSQTAQVNTQTITIKIPVIEGNGFSAKKMASIITNSFVFYSDKVVETRDFSCKGMDGFTFKYPVFEDWEYYSNEKLNEYADGSVNCDIRINISGYKPTSVEGVDGVPPWSGVKVKKIAKPGYPAPGSPVLEYPPKFAVKNINDVFYSYSEEELSGGDATPSHYGYVDFYTPGYAISISLDILSKKNGFPVDYFFQTVIESFDITRKITDGDGYYLLSDFTYQKSFLLPNDQEIVDVVKAELLKNGENADDFYLKIDPVIEAGTNLYKVFLWYKSDREKLKSVPPVIGNPSGKSRSIYYNFDLKKIVKIEFWQ